MALCHNFELPIVAEPAHVPDWLRARYCGFRLEMPQVHNQAGDAAKYGGYLPRMVALFHRQGIDERGIVRSALARELTNLFATRANFAQTYFTTDNLRGVYRQRADLIAAAQLENGAATLTAFAPRTGGGGRIRLGIFAQHFSPQTETYFTLAHFDSIDRSRFDITLYAITATGHALEQHCIERADRFVVLPENDLPAQVKRIRDDDLDILLIGTNMTAVTNPAALLGAHRLARIQIASVSSPVTTGSRHMDVMLSARWNEPAADAADHYTERLWLMPGSINYCAFQYDTGPATVSFPRSILGIRDDAMLFFSGANYFKIIPELPLTWARILAAVPGSMLLLMPFNSNWSRHYQTLPFLERFKRQLRDWKVDPDRLRVVNPVPTRADVYRVLAAADVYLDAYPFAGACSMLDPIIAGVPSIVRSGPVGRSNHGAALMRWSDSTNSCAIRPRTSAQRSRWRGSAKRERVRATLHAHKDEPPYSIRRDSRQEARARQPARGVPERYRAREAAGTANLRLELQRFADAVVGQFRVEHPHRPRTCTRCSMSAACGRKPGGL